MLFAVLYTARNVTEEKDNRSLNLFTNWKPPEGYEFKAHYALADGRRHGRRRGEYGGGSPGSAAPYAAFFDFRTVPIVEIEKAVPIFQRVNAWRDSVK